MGKLIYNKSYKREVSLSTYYLSFDGVDDYVQINSTSSLEPSGDRTYEFIIYYDGSEGNLLTQRTSSGGFGLSIKGGNTLGGVNFTVLDWNTSSGLLVPNQINHVAWKISGGTVTYFINGQNAGSTSTGTYQNISTRIVINAGLDNFNSITATYSFDIYETRIWTTALSDTTIANNQSRGSYNGTESNLELLYLANEGSGTTLNDSAGTNDGTINGATWEQG